MNADNATPVPGEFDVSGLPGHLHSYAWKQTYTHTYIARKLSLKAL